ncbi:MAG: S8 family serine peptidase [Novosphingobium sp.]
MHFKIAATIAALPLLALATPASAQARGEKIANSYICVFKNAAVARGNVAAEANRSASAGGGQVGHVYENAIKGFSVNASAQGVAMMRAHNPNIAYCEQDQVVALVDSVNGKGKPGGGTTQPPQTTPWGITRVGGGVGGATGTAWVIDTGIDYTHPDLNVDTVRSRTFLGARTKPNDENGHGTHVAGTIGAYDNAIGVIGVAPGVRVVAVRVLGRTGSGTTSGVVAGIDYVAGAGSPGDVANMSLGGGASSALDTAVVNAAAGGIRFALAAGNETDDANNHSPARANGPNVFTVSAFAQGDTFASFSNYGNPPIEFSEPGVAVKSTWLNGGYNTISGTSMATPHLAGLLLLGQVRDGGSVTGDRDNTPDTIGVH